MNRTYSKTRHFSLRLAIMTSILIAGCANWPFSQQAQLSQHNIEGKWSWQQEGPGGPWYGYFALEKEGNSYTGTLSDTSEGTYGDKLADINVSNGYIKFTRYGRHCIQFWEGNLKEENGQLQIIDGKWTDTRWRENLQPLEFVAVRLSGSRSSHQTLQLPTDPVTLTIVQRHSKEIPGSDGSVVVKIGDITGGQVLLEILDAYKQTIVDTVSVSPYDTVPFDVGGQQYYLSVKSLHNFLFGEDFAEFSISTKFDDQSSKIEQLLKTIESSDVTFIRNNKEATPSEAAAHLRNKWRNAQSEIMTIDGFIERIASRSSETNQPYQVKLVDGSVADMGVWLRQQLTSVE